VIGTLDKAHGVVLGVKASQDVLIALAEKPVHNSKKYEIHIGDDDNLMTKCRFIREN
jgi:hypothetical protein